MLKRDWGAESNRKLLQLFIPSKTATLLPEFAVEDVPLGRNSDDNHRYTGKNHLILPQGQIYSPILGNIISDFIFVFIFFSLSDISGYLIWSKTLMELILTLAVNFGEVWRTQLAKSTLLTSTLVPLRSFKIFSDAKERVGCREQR